MQLIKLLINQIRLSHNLKKMTKRMTTNRRKMFSISGKKVKNSLICQTIILKINSKMVHLTQKKQTTVSRGSIKICNTIAKINVSHLQVDKDNYEGCRGIVVMTTKSKKRLVRQINAQGLSSQTLVLKQVKVKIVVLNLQKVVVTTNLPMIVTRFEVQVRCVAPLFINRPRNRKVRAISTLRKV